MIPPQVAIEIFRGNAAMATQEGFEALVPAIDGLDVDQASDMFAFGAIDRLMVDTAPFGRAGYRRVFGKTAGKLPPPVAQPQTGQGRARQRVEGLAARFAGIATQTIGTAPRHRPGDAAAWTAAVFTDPRFQHPDDRGQTLLVAKQALNLRALRLRKIVEPRKPNQKFLAIHRNPLIPFIKTLRNYIRIVNAN